MINSRTAGESNLDKHEKCLIENSIMSNINVLWMQYVDICCFGMLDKEF